MTRTYSKFRFEPLHNFYLGVSKLFKECIFTYLGAEAIRSYRREPVHENDHLVKCGCLFYELWA